MNQKEGTNVFSPKGEELSKEEIKDYMSLKNYLIRTIRKSPNFYKQLETDNLSEYYTTLEELTLKDKNGNPIDDKEIYRLLGMQNTNDINDTEKVDEEEER